MADIFLSYNRDDQAIAQRFAEAFETQGFSVWWDVTLRSGEAYDQVTEEALKSARAVVVLWSKKSVASRWVRAEATIADEKGTLIPVKIEPCELPVMFRLTQTAELTQWKGDSSDKSWLTFLGDVQRLVRSQAESPDAAPVIAPSHTENMIPFVAVLPVTYRGSGEEMEFLAEDLTEEITRALGQSFYCNVISANTMAAWRGRLRDHRALLRELDARYAVECRLQLSGESLRLTVQLIGTESDSTLWSSRFTCNLSQLEDSPEEFPLSITVELDQAIGNIECSRALAKRPPCTAWEHVLRSFTILNHHTPGEGLRALDEARKAVAAAPDYGWSHAMLAKTLSASLQLDRLKLSDADQRAMVRESREAIKRALELDSNNAFVLTMLAQIYGHLGDAEAGLRLAHRATMLAPNSAEAQLALCHANFMLGRTAETIDAFNKQHRIGVSDNNRIVGETMLGICLFIEGRSAEAEVAIDKSLSHSPNYYLTLRWKAIVAADLGKEESARATIRLLRKAEPGKSIDDYLDSPKHLPIEHPRKYEAIEILRKLLEETEDDA